MLSCTECTELSRHPHITAQISLLIKSLRSLRFYFFKPATLKHCPLNLSSPHYKSRVSEGMGVLVMGEGINLFGRSTSSNTKHSITQSLGSTHLLGLSLSDPTDIDRCWSHKLTCTAAKDSICLSVLTNFPSLSVAYHT